MKFSAKQLLQMSNAVRSDALRAIRAAGSGHVGIVMSAADIVTTIYANHLRRGIDTFVLSAGHGSALLYSVLRLPNLDSFRKIGGLPGHPEFGTPGVAATTGPLGQGVGNAVGYALAAKIKKSDARVYCLCSDGDLMEGVAQESITFAGRNGLNNLIILWDDNGLSMDGVAQTDIDVPARMAAAGFDVFGVDGNNFDDINYALNLAHASANPVFIQCKTVLGRGTSVAGTPAAHGLAISNAELDALIEKYKSDVGAKLWK